MYAPTRSYYYTSSFERYFKMYCCTNMRSCYNVGLDSVSSDLFSYFDHNERRYSLSLRDLVELGFLSYLGVRHIFSINVFG